MNTKEKTFKKITALREKGLTIKEIAAVTNTPPSTVSKWLRDGIEPQKNKAVNTVANAVNDTVNNKNIPDDVSVIKKVFNKGEFNPDMTTEEVLKLFGLNPSFWEVVSYCFNSWEGMTAVDTETGKNEKKEQYQVSIKARPRKRPVLTMDDVQSFFDKNKFIRDTKEPVLTPSNDGFILNIPIADLHFGLLSSESNSGEKYNCEIARTRLMSAITRIIQNVKGMNISEISLVTLGDFFHVDNNKHTTTKGTQQQAVKPIGEIYEDGLYLMKEVIDTLVSELNAPLEYIYVPGNHDRDTGDIFAVSMAALYAGSKNVKVDSSALSFKHRMYGVTLVGYHHGDTKIDNLTGYLPNEARELYGKSKRAIMKIGHLHHFEVKAKNVANIEMQPALSGKSAWEHQQGFNSEGGLHYTLYCKTHSSTIEGSISIFDLED